MESPSSAGMLEASKNIFNIPCPNVQRSSPYFQEFTKINYPEYLDMNDYLFDKITDLQDTDLNVKIKNVDDEDSLTGEVPDGTVYVKNLTESYFNYKIQFNDLKYWQYHRNNGVSKMGYFDADANEVRYLNRAAEGLISLADTIN